MQNKKNGNTNSNNNINETKSNITKNRSLYIHIHNPKKKASSEKSLHLIGLHPQRPVLRAEVQVHQCGRDWVAVKELKLSLFGVWGLGFRV